MIAYESECERFSRELEHYGFILLEHHGIAVSLTVELSVPVGPLRLTPSQICEHDAVTVTVTVTGP